MLFKNGSTDLKLSKMFSSTLLEIIYFLSVTRASKKKKNYHQNTYQQSVLQSADQPTRRIEHFRILFTSSSVKPWGTSFKFQKRFIIAFMKSLSNPGTLQGETALTYTMQLFPKAHRLTWFETARKNQTPSCNLVNLIWSSEGHRAGSLQGVREAPNP